MDAKELADILDGSEYPLSIDKDLEAIAKDSGLVIIYGASDDLMEFGGAIYDEVSCYEGGTAYLGKDGLLENKCDNEDCPYFAELKKKAITIEAVWGKDPTWSYVTSIPHETFEIIYEDEENGVYCLGIVFSLSDLKEAGED
jgi:hypothetical protein